MEIITRYTGLFRQSVFNVNGDGDYTQISVRDDQGNEKVVFTGDDFSKKEYEKQGGQEQEYTHYYDLRGLARPKKD